MLAIAREVLAQSPVRPEGFDGFDPADLEGSLARLVTFNRASAKSHSGIYRDLMVRQRKTEVDDLLTELAGPLTDVHRRAHQGDRAGRAHLRGGQPGAARRLRAPPNGSAAR